MARCNRRCRCVAEAPFAWIGVDPVRLDMDGRLPPSGPLLRFIPIALVWHGGDKAGSANRVSRFGERAHLVAFHLRCTLDDARASQFFLAPGLQQLQLLTLRSHTRRLIDLACKLPLLATLRLESPLSTAEASLLSAAPSLTDLSVSQPEPGCWPCLLQCRKLHRLAVVGFGFTSILRSLSAELGWQRLRELSLAGFEERLDVLSAEAMDVGFSCLRSLLVLSVVGARFASRSSLNPLLAHVHRIPTLLRLLIDCIHVPGLPHSDAALLSLLRSSPNLCVEWLVGEPASDWVKSMLQPLADQLGGELTRTKEPAVLGEQSRFRLVCEA